MNKTCTDCLCQDVCRYNDGHNLWCKGDCPIIKDKSRFIELPCAVGDTVYCIQYCYDIATRKHKTRIQPKVVDFVFTTPFMAESDGMILKERDFGKTVFLTKEEAEKALKGGAE